MYKTTINNARLQAITAFDKDVQYRRWNAKHGGIYVPVSDYGKPNPYLKNLVNRDIISLDGDTLTMINPAYMTRQVHESELSDINVLGHITSLNFLRPENAADEWETAALQNFNAGLEEFSSIEIIDNIKYFRFMKPLLTEKSCLKCHEHQGYKIGDVRGGISVSIPIDTMLRNTYAKMKNHVVAETIIWIIGLAGILIGYKTNRRNEERFRILTRLSPAGIYITDPMGKGIYFNDRWCKMAGYTPESALGDDWIKGIHPDDRENVLSSWKKIVKSGGKWEQEYRFKTPRGKVTWVYGVARPMIEAGKITGYIGINTDITERRQSEILIREEREKTEMYLNLTPALVIALDVQGNITMINDRGCELLEIKRNVIIGKNWFDNFLQGSVKEDVKKVFHQLMKGDAEPIEFYENAILTTSGHEKIMRWHNSILKDVKGKITGILSSAEDITNRQRSERLQSVVYQISKAANSTKSLGEIYKSIHISLGQVLDVTNFYIAYFDENVNLLSFPFYKDEQDTAPASARPLGRGLTEYIMKTGKPLLLSKKKVEEYAQRGEIDVMGTLPELWMGAPLKVGNRVIGAIGVNSYINPDLYSEFDLKILTFVSEQVAQTIEFKQAEAQLKRSEKQHRQLSEQLKEANLLKETLLDVISHDLKNPAGVILGFSELLEEDNGDHEIVTGIRDSSKNLIKVINNISTLSKVTLGENIELKLLDLVPVIEQVSKEYLSQFKNINLALTLNLPGSLKVQANPIIAEVFKNYLSNILKYAADSKQVIINSKMEKDKVSINFIDGGAVIPEQNREMIFKRGYQLGDEKKRGRGLGLAIVKRIADAHHAEVGVLPNKPKGNIFYLKIPVK